MNVLVYEAKRRFQVSAPMALVGHRGITQVVVIETPEDIGTARFANLQLCYRFAIFHIPGLVCYRDGSFRPTSKRSRNALEVVAAVDYAEIPHMVVGTKVPIAWYEIDTDAPVDVGVAFWRRIDRATNTFAGCYMAPDWQAIFDDLILEED